MSSHHHRRLIFFLILVFAAGTLALSRVRPVDGDEGYYATAARLVSEGGTPYLDFFYPQMPLLPYIYAPVFKVVGSSLANMRLMSVAAGVLFLILWAAILRRQLGAQRGLVLAGLVMVAVNPYFLSWNVTVKTYALANLAVMVALWAAGRGLESRRDGWFMVAGAAAGLGVGVRLLYLPWACALVLSLGWLGWQDAGKRERLGAMGAGLGGMVLGLAPSVVLLVRDPERFFFNNFRYHQLRPGAQNEWAQVGPAFEGLGAALFGNPFMVFQLVLVGFGVDWCRRNPGHRFRPLLVLSGVGAMVHTTACLFPQPVYEQYFTGPLTPFLAPLAVAGMARLAQLLRKPAPVLTGVICLAAVLSAVDLQVRKTGMDWREVWSFEHLAKVSGAIKNHTEPTDLVLAFWPGYVFESAREYLPGLENHFAVGVSEKLTVPEKIHYHIAGKELLLKAFDEQLPEVVVLGAWMHELNTVINRKPSPELPRELENKYEFADVFGESKVMIRKPLPPVGAPAKFYRNLHTR